MKYILLLLLGCCSWQLIAQSVRTEGVEVPIATLQAKSLTKESLGNYETVAVNKLLDVLDYTQIIANKEYDYSMREAALEAVNQNFSEVAHIDCNWLVMESKSKITCTPKAILTQLLQQSNKDIASYQNIRIAQKLRKKTTLRYIGQLAYEKKSEEKKQTVIIDFELLRYNKQFGSQKEEVWQVFLVGN